MYSSLHFQEQVEQKIPPGIQVTETKVEAMVRDVDM